MPAARPKPARAEVKMPQPTIISVAQNKGGTAKTTTTLNLGAALAARGKRVLLIDQSISLPDQSISLADQRVLSIDHSFAAGRDPLGFLRDLNSRCTIAAGEPARARCRKANSSHPLTFGPLLVPTHVFGKGGQFRLKGSKSPT